MSSNDGGSGSPSTDELPARSGPAAGELPERERPAAPASGLAIASLVLGAVGAALGATLVWFFLALPLGLAAIGCGMAERRRTRRRVGRAAGGVVTAGMVLGGVAMLLSVAGLAVIPRVEGFVERVIGITQEDVSRDLESLETSFGQSVDHLDATLTQNVNTSTSSLAKDFERLERTSSEDLAQLEDRVSALVESVEAATSEDLSSLELSVNSDVMAVVQRLAVIEAELARLQAQLAEAEAQPPFPAP